MGGPRSKTFVVEVQENCIVQRYMFCTQGDAGVAENGNDGETIAIQACGTHKGTRCCDAMGMCSLQVGGVINVHAENVREERERHRERSGTVMLILAISCYSPSGYA